MASRCLIVEDHHLFADALTAIIGTAMPDRSFVHAATFGEARSAIESDADFDVAILDLRLPDIDGFLGLLELRRLVPGTPIVICSAYCSQDLMQTAIQFGAAGFVPKSENGNSVIRLLRASLAGRIATPEGYAVDLERPRLTPQQLRVLEMVSRGLLNKQIAYYFQVCETTIKAHVSEVLRKLDVASRTQAVLKVVQPGFLSSRSPGDGGFIQKNAGLTHARSGSGERHD